MQFLITEKRHKKQEETKTNRDRRREKRNSANGDYGGQFGTIT
jgi:hypothetical protein